MNPTPATTRPARLLLATAALLLSGGAQADLLQNGGFEIGATGWTQSGNTVFSYFDDFAPHSGLGGASFGAPPAEPAVISQTLATQPGTLYRVSFWLQNGADGTAEQPNLFSLNWNAGAPEFQLANAGRFTYTEFSQSFLATSSSTEIAFSFGNFAGYWDFDDVSVSAVPEPATAAFLVLGVMALLAARRQRT